MLYPDLFKSLEKARQAFAKVGVMMVSSGRSGKALRPTNLHVNKEMFPNDTVQSRLPDPDWLSRWLDEQICFNKHWESKVVGVLLNHLSNLFEHSFSSVQELNKYRRHLADA